MKRFGLAALAAVAFAGIATAQDAVIHAGYLLATPGDGYLRKQTIVVEDGRIVSVEAGYKPGPKGVPVINLRDAYVMPGLIDSHVHITSESGPGERIRAFEETTVDQAFDGAGYAHKTLLAGFTTVQDVGGSKGIRH